MQGPHAQMNTKRARKDVQTRKEQLNNDYHTLQPQEPSHNTQDIFYSYTGTDTKTMDYTTRNTQCTTPYSKQALARTSPTHSPLLEAKLCASVGATATCHSDHNRDRDDGPSDGLSDTRHHLYPLTQTESQFTQQGREPAGGPLHAARECLNCISRTGSQLADPPPNKHHVITRKWISNENGTPTMVANDMRYDNNVGKDREDIGDEEEPTKHYN